MGVVAQPVVDRLVVDERVVDERAGSQARLERAGDRFGRRLAHRPIRELQAAERNVERDLIVVEADPQRGHELAEQPVPGALAEIDFSARTFSSGSVSRCGR